MLRAFETAAAREIPYEILPRRSGDVASSVAGVDKSAALLNWQAKLGVEEMCASTWTWQSGNPDGYNT